MCISILMKPSNISCCSTAFSNHSASLPWLDNVASQHHSPSTKVKGAIVDGPFLSGRKSLAAIPMGSKPGSISFTKIWSKVVDEVVQNQQKKHSFTGPKAQEASSIFFCVCLCFWGKNEVCGWRTNSTNLNFELSYNLNEYFSLFLYFVRSVKRVKSLLKQYGMAWNEGTNLEPQIWLYLQQLHSIVLKSARVLNPETSIPRCSWWPWFMEQQTSLVSESLVCTFTKCQKVYS